jgi:catechol 2,3-dioxygenase-like lactoylglutathione lyase family enzyme
MRRHDRHDRVGEEGAMIGHIDTLVTSYERGALTRRQLLEGLAALATPAVLQAQAAGITKARNLHHINLQVSDVARSERFYRNLFGLGPTRVVQGPDNHGFDLPGGGIFILQRSDTPGRLDHFCIGVDGFDAEKMRAAVRASGVEGVQGTANDNFFVRDPDGIRVQVSAPDWSA